MIKKIKSLFQKDKPETQSQPDRRIGNWVIRENLPYGFVVENSSTRHEYHFLFNSDGWITGRFFFDEKKTCPEVRAFDSRGNAMVMAVLVDKLSTKISERVEVLKKKPSLTLDEQNELLNLAGLRK